MLQQDLNCLGVQLRHSHIRLKEKGWLFLLLSVAFFYCFDRQLLRLYFREAGARWGFLSSDEFEDITDQVWQRGSDE